jgi:hypothetical protein
MVVRCAKLLQPSIIYIDEAEKVRLQRVVSLAAFCLYICKRHSAE